MGETNQAYTQVAAEYEGVTFGQVQRGGRAPRGGYPALVPAGWSDKSASGATLQSSGRNRDDGLAGGYRLCGVCSGPIVCHLEPPGHPGGGGYTVAVDRRLVEFRGGTIHRQPRGVDTYHDKSLAASSLDGELMSGVVRRIGLVPHQA